MSADIPDLAVRQRAATDFDTNLVVRAGAGTGKTSLLVERVLNAVGSGRVEVGSLAAITFTDKAAGEMRERMARGLDRLRALAGDEDPPRKDDEAGRSYSYLTGEGGIDRNEVAGRALTAMEGLDQATVTTIHGFCAQLLREHPLEAGVDPDFSVDSGEQAAAWRRESWEAYLAHELGPDAARAKLWTTLLERMTLTTLGELAFAMADFGVPPALLEPPYSLPEADALLAPDARRLADEIESLLADEPGMTALTQSVFRQTLDVLRGLQVGVAEFRRRLTAQPALQTRLDKNQSVGVTRAIEDPAKFKRLASESKRLLRAARAIDDESVRLLIEAVGPFVLEFRESFLARGFISFDGLLVLARDLLRDHPGVRDALKRRFTMLLLDEFQDTDPLQYEIMLFLAEPPGDGARDAFAARLDPGRLFIVGDAKQSVYRFRGADYAAYRRSVDRIVDAGGEKLELTANFRSLEGVLKPINELFADSSVWHPSGYQPEYQAIQAVRGESGNGPRVELWTPDIDPASTAGLRREAEGQLIADAIERWVSSGEGSYREVTLLLRAFTHLALYLRPLRQRGIPFVVDGGREFLARPEVGQLIATLRTLVQPWDPAALLAFLRSPAGGVADTELAAYAAKRRGWDWRRTEPVPDCPQIERCFETLRRLSAETRDLAADAVVRVTIDRVRLMPLGAAAFEGAQRVANLRKLASAAGELARDGKLSLIEVVEALEQGRMADIEMDSPLADDAAEAVRITSIHRMKGLENRRVFIGDLARQDMRPTPERQGARVVALPTGGRGLALSTGEFCNAAHVWLSAEQQRHEDAEEIRVLYVGLTRACDDLILLAGHPRGSSRFVRALRAWGYDSEDPPADDARLLGGRVRHRRLAPPGRRGPVGTTEELDVAPALTAYEQARKLLDGDASPFATPSGLAASEAATAVGRGHGETGRAVGRVVHGWLEAWDGSEERAGSERFKQLVRRNVDSPEVDADELARDAAGVLDAFSRSPLAERYREVQILGREVPLLLEGEDGRPYRGSIDLVYRARSGELVVADYKTDRGDDDARLRDHYRPQLDIYARAVQRAFGGLFPPRAELWLLRSGRRVAVD